MFFFKADIKNIYALWPEELQQLINEDQSMLQIMLNLIQWMSVSN